MDTKNRRLKSRQFLLAVGILTIATGLAYYTSSHPMDFRVYHYGARGVFDGTRPVYGPTSGLGWPMHYRYPPFFLLLFAPLAALPLGWGAAVWVVLKMMVLVELLRAMLKRLKGGLRGQRPSPGLRPPSPRGRGTDIEPCPCPSGRGSREAAGEGLCPLNSPFGPRSFLVPCLFIAPYLIEEFRYGNAQFFVFALTAASLLLARERPALSAGSLALAISVKVWPVFFVPHLAARRDWKVVSHTLGFVALLGLLPSVYFGFRGNLNLLGQWFSQEWQTQLGSSEVWFPNQSLRGVLMRYLTVIDYSQVPDSNYQQIHFAALDPELVRAVWIIVAAAAYIGLLGIAARRRHTQGWLEHGLAFCFLALLEPFTQKYALAVLLWPALIAGCLLTKRSVRVLIYISTALVLIQPFTPGAAAQRLLQVLGFDFAAVVLLTVAVLVACLKFSNDALPA